MNPNKPHTRAASRNSSLRHAVAVGLAGAVACVAVIAVAFGFGLAGKTSVEPADSSNEAAINYPAGGQPGDAQGDAQGNAAGADAASSADARNENSNKAAVNVDGASSDDESKAAAASITGSSDGASLINANDAQHQTEYESGTVLVDFAPGADPQDALAQLAEDTGIEGLFLQEVTDSYVKIGLPASTSVEEATEAFAQSSAVSAAQPNFHYYLMEDGADDAAFSLAVGKLQADWIANVGVQGFEVNDSGAGKQWALESINAYDAWSFSRSDGNVAVAVIDNCFNIDHEDLKNNVAATYNAVTCIAGPNSDVKGGSYKADDLNHGTHVAGIIAAEANNEIGIAGVSYNAKLVLVRAATDEGSFDTDAFVNAYKYIRKEAKTYNIKVINISLGAPSGTIEDGAYTPSTNWGDDLLLKEIDEAWNEGIITVTSSGNAGTYKFAEGPVYVNAPFSCWPGDHDTCVNVIALDKPSGNSEPGRRSTSNCNIKGQKTKDISAPGESIYSTSQPGNAAYTYKSGTSMASPCVAGVLALMFAANPSLTPAEATSKLYSTATDLGDPGFDDEYGYGEVNALAALQGPACYLVGQTTMAAGNFERLEVGSDSSLPEGQWTWKSSDPNIATFVKDGSNACKVYVHGKKAGSATITASLETEDGTTLRARTVVSIFNPSILGNTTIEYGQTSQLSIDAENPSASWKWESNDTDVAQVGASTGLVTARHPGTATITASLKGRPDISASIKLTVSKANLNNGSAETYVTLPNSRYTYTGSNIEPKPTVNCNGKTLAEGTDYTVSYAKNTNAGTATVTATARGEYFTGSISKAFTIEPLSLASATVTTPYSSYAFTGKAIAPGPAVVMQGTELSPGTDYTLTYSNNVNAGTASVKATGKGNYTGTRTGTFAISKAALNSAKLSKYSYTYNGTARKPTAKVYSGSKLLKAGTDYSISYSQNKNAGYATATVKGKGNYTGTISFLFSIACAKNPLSASAKTATLKYANVKKAKRTLSRASTLTVKKAVGTVTYSKVSGSKYLTIAKKTGKVTVKKGTPRGTYKIKVKISAKGNKNYKAGSKTVTATVRVK